MQTGSILAFANIDLQADFPICLLNLEPVSVLQREQRVKAAAVVRKRKNASNPNGLKTSN